MAGLRKIDDNKGELDIKVKQIMKLIFLSTILLLSSCSTMIPSSPPMPLEEQTQKVVKDIQAEPDWLFPVDTCPLEVMPDFEKDSNYVAENCENEPSKCLEKCKDENGNACYALALFLQDKYGHEQTESEPLFLRSCKLGIVSGCTNRAAAMFNLQGDEPEAVKCSVDTFEKTCEKDDAWGCTMYGMVLMDGISRPQNLDEALKVLAKSCKYGIEDEACQRAKSLEKEILEFKNKDRHKKK